MRSADADGEGMIELESVDLVLFAGQSNMAGRGCAAEAAPCPEEAGWEYRAVSAPDALYPIGEPFGRHENVPGALDDGEKKPFQQISITVHDEQAKLILAAIKYVYDQKAVTETFTNENHNGNGLYEVVREWAELKKLR